MKLFSIFFYLIGLKLQGGCLVSRFTLYIGGTSESKTSTQTDSSTKVTTTNNQAGASEGSTAIGAGASVTVTSADPAILAKVLESNAGVTQRAFENNNATLKDALSFAALRGSEANSLVSKVLDKDPTPSNDVSSLLTGVSSVVGGNLDSAAKNVESGNRNSIITVSIISAAILLGVFVFTKNK